MRVRRRGPDGGSVTGSGIRTTGPAAVPGLTPCPRSSSGIDRCLRIEVALEHGHQGIEHALGSTLPRAEG